MSKCSRRHDGKLGSDAGDSDGHVGDERRPRQSLNDINHKINGVSDRADKVENDMEPWKADIEKQFNSLKREQADAAPRVRPHPQAAPSTTASWTPRVFLVRG